MDLQVMDGDLGRILHICFCAVSPLYVPFGIFYYVGRVYLLSGCSFTESCEEDLTLWDSYLSQYEIYTMYIALAFHTVLWFFMLRLVDIMKDGASFADALKFSVRYFKCYGQLS